MLCENNYCYWSGRYRSGDLHGYLDVPHWGDCDVQGKYDGCYDHRSLQELRSLNSDNADESLSSRENSQNKLVVISKMIFLPGYHGVGEGFKTT